MYLGKLYGNHPLQLLVTPNSCGDWSMGESYGIPERPAALLETKNFAPPRWWHPKRLLLLVLERVILLITKDDDYPIIHRVLTIPGGAGFLPSTVCLQRGGEMFITRRWIKSSFKWFFARLSMWVVEQDMPRVSEKHHPPTISTQFSSVDVFLIFEHFMCSFYSNCLLGLYVCPALWRMSRFKH